MTRSPRLLALVLLASSTLAVPAGAQTPLGEEQRASLDQALRLWAGDLVKSTSSYTVTALADGYAIRIPMARKPQAVEAGSIETGDLTLTASPLPDGAWKLSDILFPSKMLIIGAADLAGHRTRMEREIASRPGEGLIDPTLRQQGHVSLRFGETRMRSLLGGAGAQAIAVTVGESNARTEWLPRGGGRVDIALVSDAQGADMLMNLGTAAPMRDIHLTMGHLILSQQINDLDLAGAAAESGSGMALTGMLAEPDPPAAPPPAVGANGRAPLPEDSKKLFRQLLRLAKLVSGGFHQTIEANDLKVGVGEGDVELARFGWVIDGAAPGDRIAASIKLDIAGVRPPPMVAEMAGPVIPRHLTFTPKLSGLPREQTLHVLDRALADVDVQEELNALLRTGPEARVDDISFDVGPATFTGSVGVTFKQRTEDGFDAAGHFEATGIDALTKLAGSKPALAQTLLPAILFLKGLGDQRGEKLVWDLACAKANCTVNGRAVPDFSPAQ